MSKEPYKAGLIGKDIFIQRRSVAGGLVAVSDLTIGDRGLKLIVPRTRAVLSNEIHELILTDEQDAAPGKTVNRVLVLGFMEVKTGGIIAVGDAVSSAEKMLGEVAGFDETHMPNHMNIVIEAEELVGHKLKLGDEIRISRPKNS